MNSRELVYIIVLKPTKHGMLAHSPDLNITIYHRHHDIGKLMSKTKTAIKFLTEEYILNAIQIPRPLFRISDITPGTMFFLVKFNITTNSYNFESIATQLFKFRKKAGISPRSGTYCKPK